MRDDFAQLLIDTYRVGGRHTYRKFRAQAKNARDIDDLPKKQKINPYVWHWESHKEFGDNLSCLNRYLHKQVGRPWDKVMSEIRAALKRGKGSSVAKRHVLQHIDGYVSKNPLFDGKVPRTNYGTEDDGFYVDQKGFLRHRKRVYTARYRGVSSEAFDLDPYRGYEKHDGKWFYVEYEKVPKAPIFTEARKPFSDVFLGDGELSCGGVFFDGGDYRWGVDLRDVYGQIGDSPKYAVWKRRATDKEVSEARKRLQG